MFIPSRQSIVWPFVAIIVAIVVSIGSAISAVAMM